MAGVNVAKMFSNWGNYGKFVDFAKAGDRDGDTLVVCNRSDRRLVTAKDKIGNIKRSLDAKNANNDVRDFFKQAVLKLFGLKPDEVDSLPKSVKKAMVLDDYNKGKPLSVRRIRAVDAAIKKLNSSDLGKKLTVKADIVKNALWETTKRVLAAYSSEDKGAAAKKYRSTLGQISGDVCRNARDRLSEKEEERFVKRPYRMCNAKRRPVYGFMVNGRQLPVPKNDNDTVEINRFINLSLAQELTERESIKRKFLNGVKEGDFIRLNSSDPLAKKGYAGLIVTGKGTAKAVTADELMLKRLAMDYCHQGAFALPLCLEIEGSIPFGGKPVCDTSLDSVQTTNIVRSPDGSGYDVIVRQKFYNVMGLKEAARDEMKCYYDPTKPGSWSAAFVLHVGMGDGKKPVITFKEPLEVWANLPEPLPKGAITSRVLEFAKTHKKEIIKALSKDPEWKKLTAKKMGEKFDQELGNAVNATVQYVSGGKIVDVKALVIGFTPEKLSF